MVGPEDALPEPEMQEIDQMAPSPRSTASPADGEG